MTNSIRRCIPLFVIAIALPGSLMRHAAAAGVGPVYFDVTRGAHPHDVAAAPQPGGPVYYTAQATGKLGILDPRTGRVEEIALGPNSAPHGVIVGPDGAPWITDGGQNAIVRVDTETGEATVIEPPTRAPCPRADRVRQDPSRRPWSARPSARRA